VLVCGSIPSLGLWNPSSTNCRLETSSTKYPLWFGSVNAEYRGEILYKYVIASRNEFRWETCANRTLYVDSEGVSAHDDRFGQIGRSTVEPVEVNEEPVTPRIRALSSNCLRSGSPEVIISPSNFLTLSLPPSIAPYRIDDKSIFRLSCPKYSVRAQGRTWATAAHYYLGQMFLGTPNEAMLCYRISGRRDVREAAEVAYSCKASARTDWNTFYPSALHTASKTRLEQHADLCQKLLDTDASLLICTPSDTPIKEEEDDNLLGRVLMSIREDLQRAKFASFVDAGLCETKLPSQAICDMSIERCRPRKTLWRS